MKKSGLIDEWIDKVKGDYLTALALKITKMARAMLRQRLGLVP